MSVGMVSLGQTEIHPFCGGKRMHCCPWFCCTLSGTVAYLIQVHMASPGHVNLVLVEDLLQGVPQVLSHIDVTLEVVAVDG